MINRMEKEKRSIKVDWDGGYGFGRERNKKRIKFRVEIII